NEYHSIKTTFPAKIIHNIIEIFFITVNKDFHYRIFKTYCTSEREYTRIDLCSFKVIFKTMETLKKHNTFINFVLIIVFPVINFIVRRVSHFSSIYTKCVNSYILYFSFFISYIDLVLNKHVIFTHMVTVSFP